MKRFILGASIALLGCKETPPAVIMPPLTVRAIKPECVEIVLHYGEVYICPIFPQDGYAGIVQIGTLLDDAKEQFNEVTLEARQ